VEAPGIVPGGAAEAETYGLRSGDPQNSKAHRGGLVLFVEAPGIEDGAGVEANAIVH